MRGSALNDGVLDLIFVDESVVASVRRRVRGRTSENEPVPARLTLFPPCLQREVPSVVDPVGGVAPWTPPEPSCLSMSAEVSHNRSSRTRRTANLH